jgi:hypothetical protein
MPAYHQMGHQTENLVREVKGYTGIILSPVNVEPSSAKISVATWQESGLDIVFDPQLYFPRSERGQLHKWRYFPNDFDTADISSHTWWDAVLVNLVSETQSIGEIKVCSPAIVPSVANDDYYATTVRIANGLVKRLGALKTLLTLFVKIADLSSYERVMTIASIASGTKASGVYLVLQSDVVPRQELADPEQLKGAMRLIHALESAELPVLVGFTGPEVVLWKSAGANSCATGKFFNLRRFTPRRFDEPLGGGGQLPYWFEESLLASLRESDLTRFQSEGLLSNTSNNPFGIEILNQLRTNPGQPWLGLAWRCYMYWFADVQHRIDSGALVVGSLLKDAEKKWELLDEKNLLMEEVKNDGKWLRPWRRALVEYLKPPTAR